MTNPTIRSLAILALLVLCREPLAQTTWTTPRGPLNLQISVAPYEGSNLGVFSATGDGISAYFALRHQAVFGSWTVTMMQTFLDLPEHPTTEQVNLYNSLITTFPWLQKPGPAERTAAMSQIDLMLRNASGISLLSTASMSNPAVWPSEVYVSPTLAATLAGFFMASPNNIKGFAQPILGGTSTTGISSAGWRARVDHWNTFAAPGIGNMNDIWVPIYRNEVSSNHILKSSTLADTGIWLQSAGYTGASSYSSFMTTPGINSLTPREAAGSSGIIFCVVQTFAMRVDLSTSIPLAPNPFDLAGLGGTLPEFSFSEPIILRIFDLGPDSSPGDPGGLETPHPDTDVPIVGVRGQLLKLTLGNCFGTCYVAFPTTNGPEIQQVIHAGPGQVWAIVPPNAENGYISYANPVGVVIGGPSVFGTTFWAAEPPFGTLP